MGTQGWMLSKNMRTLVESETACEMIGECHFTIRQLWRLERPSHHHGLRPGQNLLVADACPCLKLVVLDPLKLV